MKTKIFTLAALAFAFACSTKAANNTTHCPKVLQETIMKNTISWRTTDASNLETNQAKENGERKMTVVLFHWKTQSLQLSEAGLQKNATLQSSEAGLY